MHNLWRSRYFRIGTGKVKLTLMEQSTPAAAALRLLRVLSRGELSELATSLGLENATARQIADALSDLPRYEIARVALQAASSTIHLLKDIFQALTDVGVSVRTTGCVFVLADPTDDRRSELEFSPQAIGHVCEWQADRNWRKLQGSLSDLKSRWAKFHPVFARMIQEAEPDRRKGRIDLVKSTIRGREVREPDDEVRNEGAERILRFVLDRVSAIASRIPQPERDGLPGEIQWILRDADEFVRASEQVLPRHVARWEKTEPRSYELRPYERFLQDFDRTREDLNLLADMTEGERLLDMLRLDVWSSRPQVFEVWVLLAVLRWFAKRGYDVRLLKLEQSIAAVKWRLAYAKDSSPCASIAGGRPGSPLPAYLFYQLYRPSGDMPDIALLTGPEPDSARVWTIDPKHSERAGYSIEDYRKTALRYRNSFGSPLSIVAEYFRRPECDDNPVQFDRGALLIHDCGPRRPGYGLLLDELARVHPCLATTLVCIDVSQSFASSLPSVLPRVQAHIQESEERVLDDFLWFAGSAARSTGLRSLLSSLQPWTASSVGVEDGTRAAPLLVAIEILQQETPITQVLVVTDGGFDVGLESVVQQLRDKGLTVQIVECARSTAGLLQ